MKSLASNTDEIFKQKEINLNLSNYLTHLKVQNNRMLIVEDWVNVSIICTKSFTKTAVNLPLCKDDNVKHVYMDNNGCHALISTNKGDNFYLNLKTALLSALKRLKNNVISGVVWITDLKSDADSVFLLLGTEKGVIIETNITNISNSTSLNINYYKKWESILNSNLMITSLNFFQCTDDNKKYMLFICMPGRLYIFCEQPKFSVIDEQPVICSVWAMTIAEQSGGVLQSFFNFNKNDSLRYFSYKKRENSNVSNLVFLKDTPTKFCWFTKEFVIFGEIDFVAKKSILKTIKEPKCLTDLFDFITNEHCITFDKINDNFYNGVLTNYHALCLFESRLIAYSIINKNIVFEDKIETSNPFFNMLTLNIEKDNVTQLIWCFKNDNVYQYQPYNETKYLWRTYLEKEDFNKARQLTSVLNDPKPYQLVIRREAEKLINEKNYLAAAEILAESTDSFENLILYFTKNKNESQKGLIRFLELKLNKLQNSTNTIKRDIIVIWLLDLKLKEIMKLRINFDDENMTKLINNLKITDDLSEDLAEKTENLLKTPNLSSETRELEISRLQEDLYNFFNQAIVNDSITANKTAIYRIISTHSDIETHLYLANKLKDYEVVLKILILQGKYLEALNLLETQKNPLFYYKYIFELFDKIPTESIKALLDNAKILNVNRLLPVFYKCFENLNTTLKENEKVNSKMIAATFYYFSQIIDEKLPENAALGVDKSVHNFVINLYAIFKPNFLLNYLKKFGKKSSKLPYDVNYAIRICFEKNLYDCCVYLYCIEELFEEAIDFALKIDINLALQCAIEMNEIAESNGLSNVINEFNQFLETNIFLDETLEPKKNFTLEQRKHIWLKIIRHLIEKNNENPDDNIATCMKILKDSKGVLKVQDVLTYFPNFTSINHFKEPLCAYLKEHSEKIQLLRKEMTETAEMAKEIRGELEKKKSKFMVVKMSDKCTFCNEDLLTQSFYAFVCRHFVHKNCVEKYYLQSGFTKEEKELYIKLNQEEKFLCKTLETLNESEQKLKEKNSLLSKLQQVQNTLKNLLADDCPLCGIRIINSIDKPFFTDEEYKTEMKKW